jgi:flagellar biosynthesis/type III secretory pathway protein FliH
VVDCSLPEGHPDRVQIIPLTDEEIAERDAQAAQAAIEQEEREAAEAAKAAAKAAAMSKLEKLGLTQDEITALLG